MPDALNGAPQRYLLVSSYVAPRVGGVERYVEWLRLALLAKGMEVRVVATEAEDHGTADIRLDATFLAAAGWPLVWPTPRNLRSLVRAVRWSEVVLVHSHAHILCLYAAAVAFVLRRPRLTFVHTAQPSTGGSRAYRAVAWLYDRTATRLTFALAPPVTLARSAAEYLWSDFRVRARAVRFPVEGLPQRVQPPDPVAGPVRVAWAGRLAAEKDPVLAIRALDACRETYGWDLRLDMFGDGPSLSRVVEASRARPWIRLHGSQSHETVLGHQARAHFVLSSSRQESLGIVVLESLCIGTPTLAPALGDAVHMFGDGLREFLLPPPDPDGKQWAEQAARTIDALLRGWDQCGIRFERHADELAARYGSEGALESVIDAVRAVR